MPGDFREHLFRGFSRKAPVGCAQITAPRGRMFSWMVTRSTMSRGSRRSAAADALFVARSTGCSTSPKSSSGCVRKKRKALSPSKSPTIGMSPGAAPLLRVSSGSAARKNVPGGIGGPRYCLIALSVAVEITHQWNVARKAPRLSVPIASAARENVPGESGGPPHAISLFPSPLKSAQTGSVRTKRLIAASRTALTRGITACMARMRS
jgi:hypothetical protein